MSIRCLFVVFVLFCFVFSCRAEHDALYGSRVPFVWWDWQSIHHSTPDTNTTNIHQQSHSPAANPRKNHGRSALQKHGQTNVPFVSHFSHPAYVVIIFAVGILALGFTLGNLVTL